MRKRTRALTVAVILALPFVVEGVFRLGLFIQQRASDPGEPVFILVGVGESTMNGFPFEPYISIPKVVAEMFDDSIGDRTIVVENLARDGHPIWAQYVIFAQAVAYRDAQTPGAAIVYSGHNEGDLRGHASWRPGLLEILAGHSYVARALQLELVKRHVLRRPRDLLAYEYFLRRTIETARHAGLLPILSTTAGNVAGVEPNLETSDADAVEAAMALVEQRMKLGDCASIETGCVDDPDAADPLAPLLCYQAGKCFQAHGETAKAEALYQKAVDLDPRTVFGRATSAQNAVVRRLGAEYGIPVVDAASLLATASPTGLLGNDLFGDGHHPNLESLLLISRGYADAIAAALSTEVPRRSLTAGEIVEELRFTPMSRARSHVLSASWLIASAAHHPWPYDRLSLAETHLRDALAIAPNDFTAWFQMAVARAARRGLLRQADVVEKLGEWSVFYRPIVCVPDEELAPMIERFRSMGVEETILAAVHEKRAGACAGDGA